ncbi:Trafficking protein particle complex subunit 2-like protein [Quaeritorhiza haematococci]|nr:Trafficking protein particle complex subunit 2-like protein [Quaeritorhiza haematococci]
MIAVHCIAVIGRANNPLFIKNFNPTHQDLKYHYVAHTSCDIIEERVNATSRHSDLYLGLLYSMEDLAVYGYSTNTRIKFVIVTTNEDQTIKDAEMKSLFRQIHNAYVNLVTNPFFDPDSTRMITSKSFVKTMDAVAGVSS